MRNFQKIVLIITALVFIRCGGSNEEIVVDPAFTAYISSFTSGIVSNSDPIVIKFTQDIAESKRSTEVDDLFDLSPDVEGRINWIDDRTVSFIPEEPLESAERYVVQFELDEIMDVEDGLETFEFSVQVITQAVFVQVSGMQSYSMTNLNWQQIIGQVQCADNASSELIEKMFKATQEGTNRKIRWTHFAGGRVHEFVIDSVARKESRSNLELTWDNDILNIEGNDEMTYEIPSLSEFMVMDIQVIQEPEQKIEIRFSDPLKPNQNLDGLIYFKNGTDIRMTVDVNKVTVFPQKKLAGDHELIIEKFIVNVLDYELMSGRNQHLAFTSHKPAVQILGKGVIVPNTNGVVLPFKAVNLSAVDVRIVKIFENNVAQFLQNNMLDGSEQMTRVARLIHKGTINLKSDHPINYGVWNNFYLNLNDFIKTEPGAIYRVSLSFRPSQSLYACDNKPRDVVIENTGLVDPEFAEFDRAAEDYYYYRDYYYQYVEGYDWDEEENPCHISYYTRGNNVVSRNILASDLGIIAKGGNEKNMHVFVTDIKTSDPLVGVEVDLYNFQQQVIATATTNSDGMATIKVDNHVPYLLIAKSDAQRGYLRLDDGTSRSVSMFNVDGKSLNKGLNGFIYGERGVWRPGDSLFLTFMLEDELKILPKGHPVVMEIFTPENKLYSKNIQVRNVNGFYDFRTSTNDQAPTGNWLAKVKVGGSTFYKTLKIEAIKPNRLKIELDFGTEILEKGSSIEGELKTAWLHGAKASNLKAEVAMSLSNANTTFKDFPGFKFDDPTKDFSTDEKIVYSGNVNEEGVADIYPNISISDNAPGMLNARFVTRVFEKGGDFSIDRYDVKYSPFNSYVGVKMPEGKGWNGAIYSDETTLVPIITVDEKGNPVDRKNLKVEIYQMNWRWWWENSNYNNLARYVSNKSKYLVSTGYVNTVNGKTTYEMKFDKNQYGRRLIMITDPISRHTTGQVFYLSYSGWWNDKSASNPGGAEMLTFTTDKKEYNVGEKVRVNLPAFKEGRALVSIEDGSKVIDKFWITPDAITSGNGIEIKTTPAMAPNVYINITLVQPHHKKSNNLPMRMYGIEKIKVVDPNTVLKPEIEMAESLEPEKPVKISVRETNGRKMTYTIAMVDEGLLDLTRFKTPDPWSEFFQLQALGVKTWDLYPYILGDFGANENNMLAIGGDDYLNNKDKKKANRFKPVVKFLGPFELGAGDENDHEFIMPNYIGSVRTMVVAGYEGAYGSSDFTSKVKKPVMILPTVPRVIGPQEKMRIPVSVFAMEDNVKSVTVTMNTNSNFEITGSATQTVSFSEVGEKMVYFEAKAKAVIGIGKLDFNASSGSLKSSYSVEMEIRAANPKLTKIIDGRAEVNGSWAQSYESFGVSGTGKVTLELTSLPPIGIERHLKYLVRYPHGCIEQTTSSVFAQLILPEIMELDDSRKEEIEKNIKAGINRITSFQTSAGGLSYWPGEGYASEWGTNYGGHFMIEAKKRGYVVPNNFMKSWIHFQKNIANSWRKAGNTYEQSQSELTQAYRLYLLAKSGNPALGAMNRLRKESISLAATWRLAGAYALSGKTDVAKSMVEGLGYEVPDYRALSYTYGSRFRDQAMILEVMTEVDNSATLDLMMDLAQRLSDARWLSTQETAYSLLAISKAAEAKAGGDRRVKGAVTINGKKTEVASDKSFYQLDLPAKKGVNTSILVSNSGGKLLFARIYIEGVPVAGEEVAQSNFLNMTTRYLDMSGREIDPDFLQQGQDFIAEVTVKNPGTRLDYKEMALNQIFPSGWEIRNTRMDEAPDADKKMNYRYQDVRDDRVYTYFDLKKYESKTFKILLNASYTGKYYLPSFVCSAMYDDNIKANSRGRWVEVVDPTAN